MAHDKKQQSRQARQIKTGIIVFLILVSMATAVYFRSYPASLPIADQWAEQSIKSSMKQQVAARVSQQYPNLPPERQQKLVQQQLDQVMERQGDSFGQQAERQAELIRGEMQKDDNQTYLLAIDPYFYYRMTQNVVDHGYAADTIKDGTKWNTHKRAPIGSSKEEDNIHPHLSAGVYKIVKFFDNDAKLFNVFFWIPVLIASLAVIPAFFITRKRAGLLGGFIASMLVAVHTTFLGRTAAGFSDTDPYNVTLPLFILWAFLETFESKSLNRKLILGGVTGLLIGIYAKAWAGWWYVFDFALGVMVAYLIYKVIQAYREHKTKKWKRAFSQAEVRRTATSIGAILASSGLFVTLFKGFQTFLSAPLSPLRVTSIQQAAKANLWPNVFTTVAELNTTSLNTVVNHIGGSAHFYIACLGMVITLVSVKELKQRDWVLLGGSAFLYLLLLTKPFLQGNRYLYLILLLVPVIAALFILIKDKDADVKFPLFLAIWFAGTVYAGTQGIRFILLLVPAFTVAFGTLIGRAYMMVSNWTKKHWDVEQTWVRTGLVVLALLLLINPISSAHDAATQEIPSMNDDWWASLNKIQEESEPDAIINSWWDFGHWFKAIADRAVTFDGGSQNTPMAHWIGNVLSTSDEQRAIGTLRMLDCGSRKGFETLALALQDQSYAKEAVSNISPGTTVEAKDLMDKLVHIKTKEEAAAHLREYGVKEKYIDDITSLTHCEPPENYFITSGDMVGKASVWGHFGNWDFKKAYAYEELSDKPKEEAVPVLAELFGTTEKEAQQTYVDMLGLQNQEQVNQWISPWPQYMNGRPASCEEGNGTITCGFNAGLGRQQGQRIRLEQAVVDKDNPENSTFVISAYHAQTRQRLGGNRIKPAAVTIGDNDSLERTELENPGMNFEIVVVPQGDGYQAVIASPELATSMFTRLYFFDGAYTEHFDKFSDRTSRLNGDRIIVWKVDWPTS